MMRTLRLLLPIVLPFALACDGEFIAPEIEMDPQTVPVHVSLVTPADADLDALTLTVLGARPVPIRTYRLEVPAPGEASTLTLQLPVGLGARFRAEGSIDGQSTHAAAGSLVAKRPATHLAVALQAVTSEVTSPPRPVPPPVDTTSTVDTTTPPPLVVEADTGAVFQGALTSLEASVGTSFELTVRVARGESPVAGRSVTIKSRIPGMVRPRARECRTATNGTCTVAVEVRANARVGHVIDLVASVEEAAHVLAVQIVE